MKSELYRYEPETPAWIEAGREGRFSFRMQRAGFAELSLTACCDADWRVAGRESVLLTLLLNGEYNQDVVLFYGERWLEYPRLLGYLEAGSYEVELRFHEQSSPVASMAQVKSAVVSFVDRDSELGLAYRYTPVLYGRDITHPVESRFTDTPLVMFYLMEQDGERTVLEYQVLYSHEDQGTPAPLLMSKWGRLTDIEWTLRVVLDHDGEMVEATYQGPEHVTMPFRGAFAMGGHPVMQAATANGMVTDVPTSSYRLLMPPMYRWDPAHEPRERVMDAFPFTYEMMAWEIGRQGAGLDGFEVPEDLMAQASVWEFTDVRDYLYVQTSKWAANASLQNKTYVDIRVRLKSGPGIWYSSSFDDSRIGDWRIAYTGPYPCFATTVKLPPGTVLDDIEAVEAKLLEGGDDRVKVEGLKAFFLGEDGLPGVAAVTDKAVELTAAEPVAVLWRGE